MKFLVTGLGSIGQRHAQNLLDLGHEVYGEDTDDAKIIEAENYGVKRFEGELLRSIGAAIIATPTSWHAKHLAFAVSMGWHCLVEKPIAETSDGGLEVVLALAKKKNLVVMVGNNQRFRNCVQEAKKLMSFMGQPFSARFTLSQHNTKYTDHVILNWGAHELDLARYLLGPCDVVASVGNRDIANITLQHENGCQTSVRLDYVGNPDVRDFLIVGKPFRVIGDLEKIPDNDESYVTEVKTFIDRINGKPDDIGASGSDGLEALKLITAATEMAQ